MPPPKHAAHHPAAAHAGPAAAEGIELIDEDGTAAPFLGPLLGPSGSSSAPSKCPIPRNIPAKDAPEVVMMAAAAGGDGLGQHGLTVPGGPDHQDARSTSPPD